MRRLTFGIALFLLAAVNVHAEIEIVLKNTFIEQFKDRATISANMTVDKAHKKANPASKDGDLHFAGRASEIGLPFVAEIMNAKEETAAVDAVHAVEGTNTKLPVVGAWRLWCEHGGNSEQIQGKAVPKATTTNPDHVFQIHPTTKVGDEKTADALKPIDGFNTKDAQTAFTKYESISSVIKKEGTKTRITTTMAGFNYTQFVIELNEAPFMVEDGAFVRAKALDLEGELLVRSRRMVFIKGSKPFERVKNGKEGDRLHVLGVPRINLALVSWRTHNSAKRPEVLDWSLPYEMVIVAVYEDGVPPREEE